MKREKFVLLFLFFFSGIIAGLGIVDKNVAAGLIMIFIGVFFALMALLTFASLVKVFKCHYIQYLLFFSVQPTYYSPTVIDKYIYCIFNPNLTTIFLLYEFSHSTKYLSITVIWLAFYSIQLAIHPLIRNWNVFIGRGDNPNLDHKKTM